jgi:hypothetical protein
MSTDDAGGLFLRERIRVRGEGDWARLQVPDAVAPGVVLLQRLGPDDERGRCRFAAFWHGRRPGTPPQAPPVSGEVYLADLSSFAAREHGDWGHVVLSWPDGGRL